jgi:hypothetical protein
MFTQNNLVSSLENSKKLDRKLFFEEKKFLAWNIEANNLYLKLTHFYYKCPDVSKSHEKLC